MIDIFKKYCEIKKSQHLYGYVRKDDEGKLFVETFEGKIITHLGYSKSEPDFYLSYVDKLVSVSYATCGYDVKCQIGKPYQKCVKNGTYSPNKCAVVFLKQVDLENETINLSFKQLNELNENIKGENWKEKY